MERAEPRPTSLSRSIAPASWYMIQAKLPSEFKIASVRIAKDEDSIIDEEERTEFQFTN